MLPGPNSISYTGYAIRTPKDPTANTADLKMYGNFSRTRCLYRTASPTPTIPAITMQPLIMSGEVRNWTVDATPMSRPRTQGDIRCLRTSSSPNKSRSGGMGTKIRSMCSSWAAMYGPNAYRSPPMNAACHDEHHLRSTRNMLPPETAKHRRMRKLKAATGPSVAVIGHTRIPRSGTDVLSARLTPPG